MSKGINYVSTPEILEVQVIVVTCGPFSGRIGHNDDDDFILCSEMSRDELRLYKAAGVEFGYLMPDIEDEDEEGPYGPGTHCELVYFGTILNTTGYYPIPRQALRPATMSDLVSRYQMISDEIMNEAMAMPGQTNHKELASLLAEQVLIMDEIWRREAMVVSGGSKDRSVFLCHSSKDKPFVRQIGNDLANQGFKVWIDEYEIKVGDSIVDKISEATEHSFALVICVSTSSVDAPWVKREWQSTLSRSLSGSSVKILPALIEEVNLPPILSDIKYADFRTKYHDGLKDLIRALST